MTLKKGVKLLEETEGEGKAVLRQKYYVLAIRISLNKGEIIRTPDRCLSRQIDNNLRVQDDGFFEHRVRIDRENLIPGIFYAAEDMRVGGYRKVAIGPHLAYRDVGVPGVIPPNAKLIVELKVIREAKDG